MANYFVPYSGKTPAAIWVNGHRLLILARDQNIFDDKLDRFGADRIKKVKIENPAEESSPELEKLARSVNGGVVIAPQDLELGDLIKNLETQLPWLQ